MKSYGAATVRLTRRGEIVGLCRAAANGDRYLADIDDDADRIGGAPW